MATHFDKRTSIPEDASRAFAWHTRAGAFERLTPPWEAVEVVEGGGSILPGSRLVIRMHVGPFSRDWVAEHREYEPGRVFRDVQLSGPFRHWDHSHFFEPGQDGSFVMHDHVEYELPLGGLGAAFGGGLVHRKLEAMFRYRHETLRDDLALHAKFAALPRRRVLMAGAGGMIGRVAVAMLTTGGHEVARLVRPGQRAGPGTIAWDPARGVIDRGAVERFEPHAVINLAGSPIAVRWNERRKRLIRESRLSSTRLLAQAIAGLSGERPALLSSSGVGIYGDRGEESLDESATLGRSFLADLAREWEEATKPAEAAGSRVVLLRIGMVLSPRQGALRSMLPWFKLGLGGKLGSGRQFTPWISIDDCAGAIVHAVMSPDLAGPVNVVAPEAVTNLEFSRTLAKTLRRPLLGVCPASAAGLLFGELAREGPLASQRAVPGRLGASGYTFRHPGLGSALGHVLGA